MEIYPPIGNYGPEIVTLIVFVVTTPIALVASAEENQLLAHQDDSRSRHACCNPALRGETGIGQGFGTKLH